MSIIKKFLTVVGLGPSEPPAPFVPEKTVVRITLVDGTEYTKTFESDNDMTYMGQRWITPSWSKFREWRSNDVLRVAPKIFVPREQVRKIEVIE